MEQRQLLAVSFYTVLLNYYSVVLDSHKHLSKFLTLLFLMFSGGREKVNWELIG